MDKVRSAPRIQGAVALMARAPRLGRNLFAMIAWQVGNYLVPLATFPYLTRVLGPTHFGILGYASAIAVYGVLWTDWGFNLSGPRAIVECRGSKTDINELIWSVIFAKALLCVVSLLALGVAMHFDRQAAAVLPVALMSWIAVVSNVFTLNWVLQGLERFSLFATVSLLGRFVTLPLIFVFVKSADDIAIAAAIQAFAPCLTALFSLLMVRRLGFLGQPGRAWCSAVRRLAQGADMFVSTISVSLFGVSNTVLLAALSGPYQVGLYAAADRIKTVGNMVPAQINTVLYPRVSALMLDRPRSAAKLTALGAAATLAITGAGVFAVTALSGYVTSVILGRGFGAAAPVLTLLCLATVFGNLAYMLGLQVLVPFANGKLRSIVMLFAGILNIGLSFALIPRFGARGAAWAFLIAEAVILIVFVLVIVGSPRMRAHFTQLLRV
ncbi:flippase [Paraburkholderia sp. J8-2]|uniref:flippase n=1 Tax=Paraburkholderia sp. J8-2 TaxID=2805440 RepID=UPI002AB6810B|nr:flippase [Paraburkholderia sp. J8-2]